MKLLNYFLLSGFILLTMVISAQTIYVDALNNTGVEDGTEQHPFNTIKEGITAAVPGTTVMIMQGTYVPDDSWSGNDHTLLLKAGVKVIGQSPENSIINGIVVDEEVSNLSISLENLTFNEFHFARGTIAGPFDEQNIIRNCSTALISLPFGAGIPVNDSTPGPNYSFLIENNNLGAEGVIEFKNGSGVSEMNVLDNTCGYIYLKCGSGYTFLIDNNDVQYGIFDKSASNPTTISNNRISNGVISDYSGSNQLGIEDEIIENNIISSDESSPAFIDEDYKAGIIAKSRSVTIRNNTITCTGHVSGIRSSAGAPLHINDNTITLDEVQTPNPDPVEGTIGIFNYSGWGTVTGNNIYGGQNGYFSKAGTVLFADNMIQKAYSGFYSMGAEEVRQNTIKECNGDGMILDGLRGPIHDNVIKDNVGAGIRLLRPNIDLGGGADTCPGNNVIMGNGNYDLYIEALSEQYPTVFARYNVWDHTVPADIAQYDIRDSNDSTGLVTVDFTPFAYLGVEDNSMEAWGVGGMEIWPNPCREVLSVKVLGISAGRDSELAIYDIFGRLVIYSTPIIPPNGGIRGGLEGGLSLRINVEAFPPGVYILILRNETDILASKKFVVAR
jgi:hypothetical protein